jgi:beta-N-acetylhexosaminidase
VMTEGHYSSEGQVFAQEVHQRFPKAALATLDPSMPRAAADAAVANLQDCSSYVIAAYSAAAGYRGTISLGGELPRVIEELVASGKPVTLVAFGNPYMLRDFPNVSAYLATFSTTPTSEIAAARGLFGEIPIAGHLPVGIPGLAQLGEGLQLDASRPVTAQAR